MSDGKGKGGAQRRPSGYRAPASAAEPEARRGFLDSLFAPRIPGASPMPKLRTTFARGFALATSTPAIVIGLPLVALGVWLALLAGGFQGPFSYLYSLLAFSPIGTSVDWSVSANVFGGAAQFGVLGFLVVRALLVGLVTTIAVERYRTGTVSRWAVARAFRILPTTITVNVAGFALLVIAQLLLAFLGPGLGLLGVVAAMVAGVYFFAFAPTIAADEDRKMPAVMQRSIRAARLPQSGNLTLAGLYTLGATAVVLAPTPGSLIGVNPTIGAWVAVLIANLLHAAILATFSFRYLCVADAVPEAPAPAARSRR
jgi:hypothetical protein